MHGENAAAGHTTGRTYCAVFHPGRFHFFGSSSPSNDIVISFTSFVCSVLSETSGPTIRSTSRDRAESGETLGATVAMREQGVARSEKALRVPAGEVFKCG